MFPHTNLENNFKGNRQLYNLIAGEHITLAGNSHLKIYGRLHCTSGKRMKRANRVFFTSEHEAIAHGYRPCAHCMRKQYEAWKLTNLSTRSSS